MCLYALNEHLIAKCVVNPCINTVHWKDFVFNTNTVSKYWIYLNFTWYSSKLYNKQLKLPVNIKFEVLCIDILKVWELCHWHIVFFSTETQPGLIFGQNPSPNLRTVFLDHKSVWTLSPIFSWLYRLKQKC